MLNNNYAKSSGTVEKKDVEKLLSSVKTLSDEEIRTICKIREKSASLNKTSQTSEQYQNDMLNALVKSLSTHSGVVVEIGTFKGGISCQLAYIAKRYKRKLYLVDISPEFCQITKEHLKDQNLLDSNVQIINGTIADLFRQVDFCQAPPCFMLVDAWHTYTGVRIDICHILSNVPNTPVIGFHDYGLRTIRLDNTATITRVDRAIIDVIGDTNSLHPIGFTGTDKYEDCDDPSYFYFEEGCPEGVLLFTALLNPTALTNAYSYCTLESLKRVEASLCNLTVKQAEENARDIPCVSSDSLAHVVKNSRWIKLGRKLGFLKALGPRN